MRGKHSAFIENGNDVASALKSYADNAMNQVGEITAQLKIIQKQAAEEEAALMKADSTASYEAMSNGTKCQS